MHKTTANPAPINPAQPPSRIERFWSRLYVGIVIAGGLYPVAVVTVAVLASLPFLIVVGIQQGEWLTIILSPVFYGLAIVIYSLFLFGLGMTLTAMIALAPIFGTWATLRFIDWRPARDRLAAFVGALVAFFCTLLLWRWMQDVPGWSPTWFVQALLAVSAVVWAQSAGLFADLTSLRRSTKHPTASRPLRFSTRTMLVLMAPIGLVLSLLRIANLLDQRTIALAVICTLTHLLTRDLCAWVVNRWLDWRLTRRRSRRWVDRST